MAELVITRGIPASGKSTWAKAWVLEDPTKRYRINRDATRFTQGIKTGVSTFEQEVMISVAHHAQGLAVLKTGKDVVVDDTNLRSRYVKGWLRVARDAGATVRVVDFPIELDEAIRRDEARDRTVGAEVITDYYQRLTPKGKLPEMPILSDPVSEDHVFAPYVPGKIVASSFDIDGTLAHMGDRRGPYDAHLYHLDVVDERIRELLWDAEAKGHEIIILTGRSDSGREATEKWLAANLIFPSRVLMRKEGDQRNDGIVKSEMVDEHVSHVYDVRIHYDDRNRVVDALRAKGIKVAQVEPGDF